MIRLFTALAVLSALTGCVGVPEGSACKFWDNVPYDGSQEYWRDFDCPLQGQRAMFHTKGPQPKF